MLCTIITYEGRQELMYGRQELTGIDAPRFFEVSQALVEEIRVCAVEEIQSVISKIKTICPEIF